MKAASRAGRAHALPLLVSIAVAFATACGEDAGLVSVDGCRMAFACGVFYEASVACAKDLGRAVAEANLKLTRQDYHELAARRGMPVLKFASRILSENKV